MPRSRIQTLQHLCTVAEPTPHPAHQNPESPPAGHPQAAPTAQEGRKELFHTLSPAITSSWHHVLGVSHPLLVSHPSSVPAAASLPLAHSSCTGSAVLPAAGQAGGSSLCWSNPPLPKREQALLGRHSTVRNIWKKQKRTPFCPNSFSLSGGTGWGTGLGAAVLVWTDTKHTEHLPGTATASALSTGFAQQGQLCLGTKTCCSDPWASSADGTAQPCPRKHTWLLRSNPHTSSSCSRA